MHSTFSIIFLAVFFQLERKNIYVPFRIVRVSPHHFCLSSILLILLFIYFSPISMQSSNQSAGFFFIEAKMKEEDFYIWKQNLLRRGRELVTSEMSLHSSTT